MKYDFTRIAHGLLEYWCKLKIPPEAMRVLLAIARETYGYADQIKQKKLRAISLNKFQSLTKLSKPSINRSIKNLKELGLVEVNKLGYECEYRIKKNKDKWREMRDIYC